MNERPERTFMFLLMREIGDDTLPEARAKRAWVRRGTGRVIGEVPDVSRVLEPLLGRVEQPIAAHDRQIFDELAYMIAPLYALHTQYTENGNMGAHFRQLGAPDSPPPASVERRFVALLGAGREELSDVLRQCVLLLKAQSIGVNWPQLFADLMRSYRRETDRDEVRRAWSRDFWREKLPQVAVTTPEPSDSSAS